MTVYYRKWGAVQAISRLATDSGASFIAAAVVNGNVVLYRWGSDMQSLRIMGRLKTHTDQCVGICFGESPSGETRLFSLGTDIYCTFIPTAELRVLVPSGNPTARPCSTQYTYVFDSCMYTNHANHSTCTHSIQVSRTRQR